jgi:1,4-dihydroxy-2-naphthoyl-CoA synthase
MGVVDDKRFDMPDILTQSESGLARLTLNRPEALHALNTHMCANMAQALLTWRDDPSIRAVLIDHAEGTRGFCAGGDIRMLAESGANDGAEARRFFHAEYRLNYLLFTFPKPIIVVMDGVTMGGGVGIALPARFRIATENTSFACGRTWPRCTRSTMVRRVSRSPAAFSASSVPSDGPCTRASSTTRPRLDADASQPARSPLTIGRTPLCGVR